MTLNELAIEWGNLTQERRDSAMLSFIAELHSDPGRYHEFIYEMMDSAAVWEGEDYFGTEGMDI